MLVCGTRDRTKVLGEETVHCESCKRETVHRFVRSRNWFTLYLIPIIPTGPPVETAHCTVCLAITRVVYEDVVEPGTPGTRECPGCGRWIKAEAFGCRSCGRVFDDAEVREAKRQAAASTDSSPDAIQKRLQR
jgi:hypothetical protein